jgi:hypothetical protein
MKITLEDTYRLETDKGGYREASIRALGVRFSEGWRERLIGLEVTDKQWESAMDFRSRTAKQARKLAKLVGSPAIRKKRGHDRPPRPESVRQESRLFRHMNQCISDLRSIGKIVPMQMNRTLIEAMRNDRGEFGLTAMAALDLAWPASEKWIEMAFRGIRNVNLRLYSIVLSGNENELAVKFAGQSDDFPDPIDQNASLDRQFDLAFDRDGD